MVPSTAAPASPAAATGDLHRPGCPRGIKVGCKRAFVFELPEALGRWLFCGGCDDQDGGCFISLATAVQTQLPVVPQGHARLRCQISAVHSEADLNEAVEAFVAVGREFGVVS